MCSFCISRFCFISSFSISSAGIPDEFISNVASTPPPSFVSSDSASQVSNLDNALHFLFSAVIDGSVVNCQELMLDCALRSLLGPSDHKLLKTAFGDAKGTRTMFKVPYPAKVGLALNKATTHCLECLRRCDPSFLSFTVPGLLSFVSKGKLF